MLGEVRGDAIEGRGESRNTEMSKMIVHAVREWRHMVQ